MILLCLAIALHDADGPIRCAAGERVRLAGIGATELDGTRRPGQPGVDGDPYAQRRALARAIGGEVAHDEPGETGDLWLLRAVPLRCDVVGRSYRRLVAWCRTPDDRDVSCVAIQVGAAARWRRFDPDDRLGGCEP